MIQACGLGLSWEEQRVKLDNSSSYVRVIVFENVEIMFESVKFSLEVVPPD